MIRRHAAVVLLLPALTCLGLVYAWPIAQMLVLSFEPPRWTVTQYRRVFQDPFILGVLVRTIRLAVEISLMCLLLGYPVAYLMRKASERRQRLIALLVILPLWTSILVRSYAWIVLLGRQGLINKALRGLGLIDAPLPLLYNRFAVYVAMVHIMLPFMVLPLFSVMRRIDLRLVAAAESLGASRLGSFLWVFLPLSLPGVAAGSLLVFIISLGFFVTPALLGGLRDVTYVMLIEKQVNELLNWPLAGAMAVVLLVVTLGLVLLYQRAEAAAPGAGAAGRGRRSVSHGAAILAGGVLRLGLGLERRLARVGLSRRARPSRVTISDIVAWLVLGALVLPLAILIPLAFSASPFLEFPPPGLSLRWFANYFSRPDWLAPTVTSFKVATLTMVLGTLCGTLAATGLVRGRFPGKTLLMAVILSPMIVPTIVIAIAIYYLFARQRLVGTTMGLVLAHLVLAIPYVVVVVAGALRTVDEALEQAALTLGAGRVQAFVRVTLPLIMPAMLTAAFFAFLASFDDLVIALFISGTRAATLPKRMWEGIRFEIDPTTAAVSALLIGLSLVLLGVAEIARIKGQRSGRAGAVEPEVR